MNRLEEEIRRAITSQPSHYDRIAKAAAEVSMKWIEKASNDLYTSGVNDGTLAMKTGNFNHIGSNPSKERWLKENRLTTPTESDKPETKQSGYGLYGYVTLETREPIIGSNGIVNTDNEAI